MNESKKVCEKRYLINSVVSEVSSDTKRCLVLSPIEQFHGTPLLQEEEEEAVPVSKQFDEDEE